MKILDEGLSRNVPGDVATVDPVPLSFGAFIGRSDPGVNLASVGNEFAVKRVLFRRLDNDEMPTNRLAAFLRLAPTQLFGEERVGAAVEGIGVGGDVRC